MRIEMLPAQDGDCLWIEYGDLSYPYRILVDGGTASTYKFIKERIEALPRELRRFDLVIISHIDSDHIGGVLRLLKRPPPGLQIGDVWFNGFRHLPARGRSLSVRQAEEVTTMLEAGRFAWNRSFNEDTIHVPDDGPLPEKFLGNGMKLTLLSPYWGELQRLQITWEKAIESLREQEKKPLRSTKSGLTLGQHLDIHELSETPFEEDLADANGSSIALLAEHKGTAVLLAADAFPKVLVNSINRLLRDRKQDNLRLDAFKVSHHGSKANTSHQLLDLLDCDKYLISTNGIKHGHPNPEAIARILQFGGAEKELYFNYVTSFSEIWRNPNYQQEFNYRAYYPESPNKELSLII
jgi:beta-lactamase superfamily II metal-dependent hydrolase